MRHLESPYFGSTSYSELYGIRCGRLENKTRKWQYFKFSAFSLVVNSLVFLGHYYLLKDDISGIPLVVLEPGV